MGMALSFPPDFQVIMRQLKSKVKITQPVIILQKFAAVCTDIG